MHQGFLLTRHSHDKGYQTEITLWLTSPDGPVRLEILGERPLFFVRQCDRCHVEEALAGLEGGYELRPLELKTFAQEAVAAVYLPTLQAFYRAQELLRPHQIEILESDFRLHDRYLMERWGRGAITYHGRRSQRKGFSQIHETRVRGGDYIPNLKAISLDLECSRHGELYSCAFFGEGVGRVLMIGEPIAEQVNDITWVANERSLLLAIQATVTELDPDVIIGWNVVNFDFRLLLKRAELHGLRLMLGRGGSYASWRDAKGESGTGFITLPGRVVIDGIAALKTATYSFASYSLEAVSQELLGRGKLTDDVEDRLATITHDFHHNKPKLAAYNLEDCRLVWDIFQQTRILDFLVLRSQVTGLELDRSGGSVAAFTNLYLPQLHRAGYVAPNLPEGGGLASPGGYVMDSVPGLYTHVLVLDFKSLYPSIIRTFKIDPMGLIEGGVNPSDAIPGYRGACFSRQHHFLPGIITALWRQRDEAKQAKDPVRSQALKILMNSFYGVLGSGGCRFYDPRLASSITLRGHDILKRTTQWIEARGLKVIYGDTDSLFVHLSGERSNAEADSLGRDLVVDINGRWQRLLADEYGLTSYLELEYETHYNRFLMPTIRGSDTGSKKRYAGLISAQGDERLVFKGLEAIRTDWTDLAKELQNEMYLKIFHDEDPSALICKIVAETRAGQRDHQLVYRKRLRRLLDAYVKNVPPHVRAARMADEKNQQAGKALRYQRKGGIAYVVTVNGPEALEYLQSPIDYEHYIDKQIQPIADAILPFVGLSFSRITDTQMGLF